MTCSIHYYCNLQILSDCLYLLVDYCCWGVIVVVGANNVVVVGYMWCHYANKWSESCSLTRGGGSRTTATSKMECFVIIVNGWKPLTIITKHFILDVAAALDPPLLTTNKLFIKVNNDFVALTFYCNLK